MKAIELKKDVYWVGGVDWRLRNFHGYLTQRGSTYNAYLIIDEKVTLIDTVKHYLYDEMLERISEIIDPSKIDYFISNHVEMDHSGSLPKIWSLVPGAPVYTSAPKGKDGLTAHYGEMNLVPVKTGDTLNIGSRTLHFVQTPMVHWPDNMLTYSAEDKILFSNDAFGQHIASCERFDTEYPYDTMMFEAKKYYANIVMPYGNQVKKALDHASKLDIEMIAPSHGLIWKEHIGEIISAYTKWSANDTDDRAVVIYDTMWGSTQKIAETLQHTFESLGVPSSLYCLQDTHISDIMTEMQESRYICVGSPTLNSNMLPTVGAFLTYLKGFSPKKRLGLAFGSYGWGGQSIPQIHEILEKAGFEMMMDDLKCKYIPSNDTLTQFAGLVSETVNRVRQG